MFHGINFNSRIAYENKVTIESNTYSKDHLEDFVFNFENSSYNVTVICLLSSTKKTLYDDMI